MFSSLPNGDSGMKCVMGSFWEKRWGKKDKKEKEGEEVKRRNEDKEMGRDLSFLNMDLKNQTLGLLLFKSGFGKWMVLIT